MLRTLPYHASWYGKLLIRKVNRGSGRLRRLGGSIAAIGMIGACLALWVPVDPLGARGAMGARQESVLYRRAHGAALGASP
jgi:hypothetical protein